MAARSRSVSEKGAPAAGGGEALCFEKALEELEEIIESMDGDEHGLEALVTRFERGTRLLAACQAQLDNAQLRIDQITIGPEGGAEVRPFAVAEGENGEVMVRSAVAAVGRVKSVAVSAAAVASLSDDEIRLF